MPHTASAANRVSLRVATEAELAARARKAPSSPEEMPQPPAPDSKEAEAIRGDVREWIKSIKKALVVRVAEHKRKDEKAKLLQQRAGAPNGNGANGAGGADGAAAATATTAAAAPRGAVPNGAQTAGSIVTDVRNAAAAPASSR